MHFPFLAKPIHATGAFLLTDQTEEVREYLTSGREIETIASHDELSDKAGYYLVHAEARERIARRPGAQPSRTGGTSHVQRPHALAACSSVRCN
ncbi:MAG: glycosyltransferase [Gammaproteobacteria bacterium]|nr:glycosyltransferase [Gammaproteobacteria bacterium]MBU1416021.1 glycosyltransferase [Gammaproteobacteria bacterium]